MSQTTYAPDTETLEKITKLGEAGLYLQAYRDAEAVGPIRYWAGTKARLLAARLASNLGGPRLAGDLVLRTCRADRDEPNACWFFANYVLDSRGPWAALKYMRSKGTFPDAEREARSYWLSLHAHVYGRARDFDNAARWLEQAEALGDDDPWIHLERAALWSMDDRVEDAIGAARRALEVRPYYRAAVQWLAHFLVQKEQDEEALALLGDASSRIESYAVTSQLGSLLLELGRYQEARDRFEECVRLAPLLDKVTAPWLASRRCDAAYHCGDFEKALEFAKQAKGKFFEVQAERLANPPAERKRVCWPVGYVRQNWVTCAPATLVSICRYWNMPGDHLEVAANITYAGTPNRAERQWAIDNGWYTKEFTITWDSARAVLDAGIPFTLTTPEVSSSHLQAVIGYDDVRNTFVIRDPGERHQVEMLATEGLERYKSSGPRGMAMVPLAEKHRLEALELPDAEIFDQVFQMERALEVHDRDRAEKIFRNLAATEGTHPQTYMAERTLAGYDADTVRLLSSIEKMLALFPDDLRLKITKISCLRDLARRSEYLELLESASKDKKTDPAFWEQYAQEIAIDAREHREAERWLKRTIRANPGAARAFSVLAGVFAAQRRFEDALDVDRIASCLEDTTEYLARNYFERAHWLGRDEEGLEFLRRRFERFGKKSSQPGQTLAWANFYLERTSAGYAVLEDAMKLRPDDGDLMLAVVDQYAQHGKFTEAWQLAVRARRKSYRPGWLRSVAYLESAQGDLRNCRKLWHQVLKVQPLADDAHRAYALALAETEGRAAALAHLHAVCERFPHHFRLTQLLMEWQQEDGPETVEPTIRKLIEMHPTDAWARRQLALNLAEQAKLDEAFVELEAAEPLEPGSIGYHGVHGVLLKQAGRFDEAKEDFKAVLRLSADHGYAMSELLNVCETPQERREALDFIEAETMKQVTNGNGLHTFRDLAEGTLEPPELLGALQKMLDARPELWPAWAVVIRQLRFLQRLDDALALAKKAIERFPLVTDLWNDLAEVHLARRDEPSAIDALKTAHGINPYWPEPLRKLADLYRRREEFDKAKSLIERAIARAPLKPEYYAIMARFLWNCGKRHEGFQQMRRTIQLDPGFESAWDDLCEWAQTLDCFSLIVELAREQTARRPGEARSWMRLAQALRSAPGKALVDDDERMAECLAALDRVLELRPWLFEAHDFKAQVLAEAQRWVEAQEACQSPVWNGRPPTYLRGRLAWIVHQRGNTEEAVERMKQAVQMDPSYYWGWSNLADWFEQLGRNDEWLQAAERLLAFDPYNPTNYVRRAEAKRLLDDPAGARADYERAAEMAPDYLYPRFQLFDTCMDAGDTEAARKLLDEADSTAAPADFQLRSLQISLIEKDVDTAVAALEDLCGSGNEWQLIAAIAEMEKAKLGDEAEDVLRRYLGGGARICNQWIFLLARKTSLEKVRERIVQIPPTHLAYLDLVLCYGSALADDGLVPQLVAWVKQHETLLRKKTMSWGKVGSFFSKILDDRRTVEWMRDWKQRKEVEPWMLMNLNICIRGLDRFADGAVVNRHVLEHFETDYTTLFHLTWLMLDDALAGEAEAVKQFFQQHELHELDANHQWVAALGQSILACLLTPTTETLEEIHERLTEVAGRLDPLDRDRAFTLAYEKSIHAMAKICGAKGSKWEKSHVETPIAPKLKPMPGEEDLDDEDEEIFDLNEIDGDEEVDSLELEEEELELDEDSLELEEEELELDDER